jgi:hypothetical protein
MSEDHWKVRAESIRTWIGSNPLKLGIPGEAKGRKKGEGTGGKEGKGEVSGGVDFLAHDCSLVVGRWSLLN